jgi:hypothetical protein
VQFKEIKILEDTSNGMWVAGLGEEARIITLGQEYVFQGQTVNVKESPAPEKHILGRELLSVLLHLNLQPTYRYLCLLIF